MRYSKLGFLLIASSTVLIVAICLGLIYFQSHPKKRFQRIEFFPLGAQIGKLTFTQRATFPTFPSTVRMYRVQPITSMKDEFLKLIDLLPIKRTPEVAVHIQKLKNAPEPKLRENEPLSGDVGGWNISVYPGGQFSLRNMTVNLDGRDATAPSVEEVRELADMFLARTKLLPTEARFDKIKDADVSVWGLGDKPGDRVVHSRWVTYQCWLDGIPTIGSFAVEVGAGKEIVCVLNEMRRTIPDQMVPILSQNDCLNKLRAGEGHMADGPSWDATAYVDSIKLMYWESILAMDLSYIMPVYVFEGEAVAPGKRTVRWKAHVEAVRPEFLEKKPVYKYHE